MTSSWLLFIPFLLTQSIALDADILPRKHNVVSFTVKKLLDPFFDELSSKPVVIPEVNLGEDVGKFSNLKMTISGGLSKEIDGYKSNGFTLSTELKNIIVKGQHDIKNLNIPGYFPIFGKGNLVLAVETLTLNMVVDPIYDVSKEQYYFEYPIFGVTGGNATVKFDNLMNDPEITVFLNNLISNLIPDLITMFNEPLLSKVKLFSDTYGNGILYCIKYETSNAEECIKKLFKPSKVSEFLSSGLLDVLKNEF